MDMDPARATVEGPYYIDTYIYIHTHICMYLCVARLLKLASIMIVALQSLTWTFFRTLQCTLDPIMASMTKNMSFGGKTEVYGAIAKFGTWDDHVSIC